MMNGKRVFAVTAIAVLVLSSLAVVVSAGSLGYMNGGQGGPNGASPASPTLPAAPNAGRTAIVRALAMVDPDLAKAERGLSPARLADLQRITLHALLPNAQANAVEAKVVEQATVHPDSYSTTGFDIQAITGLVATLCALTGIETLGMGCLIGLAVVTAGLLIACAFSLFGVCAPNAPSTVYAPAVTLFEQILGQANSFFTAGSQSLNVTVQNYDMLTNETVGVWEYEAAAAALSQLGNASFNPILDLSQSGIATQAADLVYATEYASADDMLTTMTNLADVFGPTVGAGADGIVCSAGTVSTLEYGFNGSATQYLESGVGSTLNLSGGSWGGDGKCLTGVSGSANPNGHFAGGTVLPVTANAYPVAAVNNTSIAWPLTNPLVPAGASGIEAIFSTAATHLNAHPTFDVVVPLTVPTNGYSLSPVPTLLLQGAYYYNGTWGCGGAYTACGTVGTGVSGFYGTDVAAISPSEPAFGVGFLPIGRAVTASGGINHADGGNAYDQALIFNAPEAAFVTHGGGLSGTVAILCGPAQLHFVSSLEPLTQAYELPLIDTCPASQAYQIAGMNALAMDASNVGNAYWSFLTGLGYTTVNQVPINCVIPPPESFIPPNYNVTLLSELNATTLTALSQAMLVKLAETFGTYAPTFCGIHIVAPTNLTFPSQDVIALGDIYVANASGQTFATPSTWANTSVSLAVAPSTGNLTIPINKTWEASGINPALVLYGNVSGGRDPTTHANYTVSLKNASHLFTIVRGAYTHFTGNSTEPNGSVYPHHIYARYGAGNALYLTTCYEKVAGVWTAATSCDYTVQSIHYNISKDACLLYATNCSVAPFPVVTGLDCGWSPVTEIGSLLQGIPIIGSFACAIGWLVVVVVGILVVGLVVAVWPRRHSGGGEWG